MNELVKAVEAKENYAFTEHLKTVDSVLKKHGVEYSLVGGLALKAIFNENVPARRTNGWIHDLDGLAVGPDPQTIQEALREIRLIKRGKKMFPSIGIEPIRFSDEKARYSRLSYLSTMRKNSNGQYFLTYSDIEVEIPLETMTAKDQLINGIPLPVFPEKTIFWRYFTRGGNMKKKDEQKLRQLHFHIINNGISLPEDNLYKPYFDFIMQINERYPERIWRWNKYWEFNRKKGDSISGNPLFYGLIGLFRK